jgi:hypothetical protein
MRRRIGVLVIGAALALAMGSSPARAQVAAGVVGAPYRINPYFAAPGLYGMAFGSPSVGMTRTYTSFSSPYGAGYGYGYAPYGMLPGRYGVGLWRPGFVAPGYVYGASYYRTFPLPYGPYGAPSQVPPPPVGAYAPAFGPGSYYAW